VVERVIVWMRHAKGTAWLCITLVGRTRQAAKKSSERREQERSYVNDNSPLE
jgi:hypothetical protein